MTKGNRGAAGNAFSLNRIFLKSAVALLLLTRAKFKGENIHSGINRTTNRKPKIRPLVNADEIFLSEYINNNTEHL